MRHQLCITLVALLTLVAIESRSQNSWTTGASLPADPRASGIGFSIGNKGYAGLGGVSSTTFYNDIWEYDPTLNQWTAKDSYPGAGRTGVSAFVIGSKAYVGMGQGASDFWEFDPSKTTGQQWTQKQNYPGATTYALTAMTIGSYGYAGIGDATRQWWQYDPINNQWTRKTDYPYDYYIFFTGFGIGNRGYVLNQGGGPSTEVPFIAEYDPDNNAWTPKTTFPQKRYYAIAFVIGGRGYFGSGSSANAPDTYFNDFYEYDPVADVVVAKANVTGTQRTGHFSFAVNGKGYTGAGYEFFNGYYNDLRIYTPEVMYCSVPSGTKCTGQSIAVNYNVNNLVLNAGNTITVELSNAAGSFASPVTIGTLTTTSLSGVVNATIPAGASAGTGYRVRVKSSNPAAASGANSANIKITSTVTPTINLTATPGSSVLLGTDVTITANVTNGGANPDFQWTRNGGVFGLNKSTLEYADYLNGDVIKCLVLSSAACTTSSTALSNTITMTIDPNRPGDLWARKADLAGTGRINATAFSIGGKAYVGLGSSFSNTQNDMWEYDPGNDAWTQKANSPQPMTWAASWVINDKAYVTAGFYGVTIRSTYEFNPVTNTWTQKADFPGTKRYLHFSFTANGKGYIGGGYDNINNAYLKDLWEYNPANDTWTQKADAPIARSQGFAFSVNNKGYAGGGGDGVDPVTQGLHVLHDLYEYNPANDTWTKKTDYPGNGVYYGSATSVDGKGYVQTNNDTNAFLEYDVASDTWAMKAPSPVNRSGTSMFSIGSRVYVAGGQSGASASAELWQYTPDVLSLGAIPESCPGDVRSVKWNAGKFVTFNGGNTFTVQLSDATGSFNTPTMIGTATSSAATGTVQVTFPSSVAEGNYKMRVVSSSPSYTSGPGGIIPFYARPATSVTIVSQLGNTVYDYQFPYIDATVTNGGSLPSYQWKKNGEIVAGATGSQYGPYPIKDGDAFKVVVTANLKCALPVESNEVLLTVVSGPQKITTSALDDVCEGATLNVGYTSSGIIFASNAVLQAQLSDQLGLFDNPVAIGTLSSPGVSGEIEATVPFDIAGGTYLVRVVPTTPFFNYIASPVRISETTPHVEISTLSLEVCAQRPTLFEAASGEGVTPDYQWKINGNDTGTNSSSFSTTTLVNGDVVSVVMTSKSGCSAAGGVTSNALTMTVNPSAVATVTVDVDGSLTGCIGEELTLTAHATNAGSDPTYQWVQGITALGDTESITIAPEAGIIVCMVTVSDGCTTSAMAFSDPVIAAPKEKPATPSITLSGDNGSLKVQQTGALYVYNWYRDGEKLSLNSSELPLSQEGVYKAQIGLLSSTCVSDFSANFNVVFTGDLNDHNDVVTFFPNPTDEKLTINTPGFERKQISVFQMNGRQMTDMITSGESEEFDVRSYSPGVYLLRIVKADGVIIGKFLKK